MPSIWPLLIMVDFTSAGFKNLHESENVSGLKNVSENVTEKMIYVYCAYHIRLGIISR